MCEMMIFPGIFLIFLNFDFLGCYGDKGAIAYDHDFLRLCKTMISPGFCIIFFFNFDFLESIVGLKGKKWPKMTKNSVCHASYLRNDTSYDHDFWFIYVK